MPKMSQINEYSDSVSALINCRFTASAITVTIGGESGEGGDFSVASISANLSCIHLQTRNVCKLK
jgi:hypothetical protein